MDALQTLVRIARRDLEAVRLQLAEIDSQRMQVQLRLDAHAEAVKREQAEAMRSYDGARAYAGYAQLALGQQRALEAQAKTLDDEADRLRAAVTAAHIEVKKIERLLELKDERRKAEEAAAEAAEMDETATLRAGRGA